MVDDDDVLDDDEPGDEDGLPHIPSQKSENAGKDGDDSKHAEEHS